MCLLTERTPIYTFEKLRRIRRDCEMDAGAADLNQSATRLHHAVTKDQPDTLCCSRVYRVMLIIIGISGKSSE